jgi:RsiW-degrading membrane proteinase PrsW (M82 family)
MEQIYLILLAVLPGIIFSLFLIIQDRFEREPARMLIKVFITGMIATVPTIIVELLGQNFNIFSGIWGQLFEAVVIIGFSEEYFKRLVVLRLAYINPAFNEKQDGIVYCVIAALGFATLENIFYVATYSASSPDIWITRGLLSVPVHMLLGITMGYYLSLSKFCPHPGKCRSYYSKSLYIPALLHGIFDFILMTTLPLLSLALIPFVALLWITSLLKLRRYYKESKQQFGGG